MLCFAAAHISDLWVNWKFWLADYTGGGHAKLGAWLVENHNWVRHQVQSSGSNSACHDRTMDNSATKECQFWSAIGLALTQLDGVMDGYEARRLEVAREGGSETLQELSLSKWLIMQSM